MWYTATFDKSQQSDANLPVVVLFAKAGEGFVPAMGKTFFPLLVHFFASTLSCAPLKV